MTAISTMEVGYYCKQSRNAQIK